MAAFSPNTSKVITVSAASTATRFRDRGQQLFVYNPHATDIIFIKTGNASVTVSATDGMAIPPGAYFLLNIGEADYIACIAASATTLYVTSGSGD